MRKFGALLRILLAAACGQAAQNTGRWFGDVAGFPGHGQPVSVFDSTSGTLF
jgi:hypothetical protein